MQKSSSLFLSLIIVSGLLLSACKSDANLQIDASYKDGSYSVFETYQTPAGSASMTVDLVLENGLVASVNIELLAENEVSMDYQKKFSEAVSKEIVGLPLSELKNVNNLAGSSLTLKGFNEALEQIKAEALMSPL